MLFRNKLVIVCLTVGLASSNIALAEILQLEQSSAVNLSSLTQKVYEQHPALHSELAQQQQINANTALANATFSNVATVSLNHQNDTIGSSDGFQEWEGSVMLPLWLKGQKQQQLALSETLSAELPAYKLQIRLSASAKVRELIWNVILADNATKQAHQAWQTAQKLEQDVIDRVKAGELAGTERLLVSANVLEMHSQYLIQQAELEHALENYRLVTGETNFPQLFEETLPDQQPHTLAVIDQQHPSLMILDQHINTLRAQQDLAYFDNAINPSLLVGVRRDRDDRSEQFNNSIGLGISFALDNDVYRRPAVANAAKELADAEIARQQLEKELNLTLFSELHDLKTKRQQLKLINEQNEVTQQYFLLQQRAFDLGEIDLVALLRGQTLANKAANRKSTLEIDIKHTIAKVNQALGIIL